MVETIEKMKIMNVAQELHPVLSLKETAMLMKIAKVTLSVGGTIALLILAHQKLIVAENFNAKIWFYLKRLLWANTSASLVYTMFIALEEFLKYTSRDMMKEKKCIFLLSFK